jgi:hypothetical protein
LKKALVSTPVI